MRPPPSSYAELGLSPDADRGAVDRAYRALMKRHHPDRGGDPARAAAINRAYADITRPGAISPRMSAPDLATAIFEKRLVTRRTGSPKRSRRRGPVLAVVLAVVAGAMWIERETLTTTLWDLRWRFFPSLMIDPDPGSDGNRGIAPSDSVDAPIHAETIDRSVVLARDVLAKSGLDGAGDTSERCYHDLVSTPSFAALDACLALDDAVVLVARSAATDKRFGAVALTARQLAAGRAMGGDYGGIEERLDRIRLMTLKLVQPEIQPPRTPPPRDGG